MSRGPSLTRAQRLERGLPVCLGSPHCDRQPWRRRMCRKCGAANPAYDSRLGPSSIEAIRFPLDLRARVAAAAGDAGVSLAEWTRRALTAALERASRPPE